MGSVGYRKYFFAHFSQMPWETAFPLACSSSVRFLQSLHQAQTWTTLEWLFRIRDTRTCDFYVFFVHFYGNEIPLQIAARYAYRGNSRERVEYRSEFGTVVFDEPFHQRDGLFIWMSESGRIYAGNGYERLRSLSLERETAFRGEYGDFVPESRASLQVSSSVVHLVPYDFRLHFESGEFARPIEIRP